MTRIYLLRHGQTLFNQKNLIQGSCDSKLTATGIDQAKAIKEYLTKITFACVYCSTSERTFDTATYATGGKYPIYPCKEFKEIDFGIVEGEDGGQLFRGMQNNNYANLLLNEGWLSLEGESGLNLTKRVFNKLAEITVEYPNDNILIASHGGTIMNKVMNIDALLAKQLQDGTLNGPDNCSLTIIDYTDGYRVLDYNKKVI